MLSVTYSPARWRYVITPRQSAAAIAKRLVTHLKPKSARRQYRLKLQRGGGGYIMARGIDGRERDVLVVRLCCHLALASPRIYHRRVSSSVFIKWMEMTGACARANAGRDSSLSRLGPPVRFAMTRVTLLRHCYSRNTAAHYDCSLICRDLGLARSPIRDASFF